MLVSCKICHREYVASKKSGGEFYVCSKCQAKNRDAHTTRLGLHPALERKWGGPNQGYEHYDSGSPIPKNVAGNGLSAKDEVSNKRASLSDRSSMPKIPGFEISYQIGRGAMGSVYRARQIKTGQLVAIKVLSHDLSERADLVARFEREAYALKALTDDNVVSIIDAGHVENTHYFAMEFIDGFTLRTRINRGPIGLVEACFITSQILNGLKAAHAHGIIHRDLKPENVLLAYEGHHFGNIPKRVVLVDFGLVGIGRLAFDPHPNLTRSRVTMGTVNYMAPEQHIDAKRVDHRSDLYSAGVILFEMLTGELPLGRYHLPHERGMDMPPLVDQILQKALFRKVDERYASAEMFLRDLRSLTDAVNVEVESAKGHAHKFAVPEVLSKSGSWFHKTRFAWLLVAASFFFALGIKFSLSDRADGGRAAVESTGVVKSAKKK